MLHIKIAQFEGQDMGPADEVLGHIGHKLGINLLALLHRISQLEDTIRRLESEIARKIPL